MSLLSRTWSLDGAHTVHTHTHTHTHTRSFQPYVHVISSPTPKHSAVCAIDNRSVAHYPEFTAASHVFKDANCTIQQLTSPCACSAVLTTVKVQK